MRKVAVVSSHSVSNRELRGLLKEKKIEEREGLLVLTYPPKRETNLKFTVSDRLRELVLSAGNENAEYSQIADEIYSLTAEEGIIPKDVHHYCDDVANGQLQKALIQKRESFR